MLGPLHFQHSGNADVLSVKIADPDELSSSLIEAGKLIKDESLDSVHVIMKSSSVSLLYDDSIISTFFNGMRPGAETTIHVLGSQDIPVNDGDVDDIRTSIRSSGLRLTEEALADGDEGGWILKGVKPGGSENDDD
jgi:hypothetical protein